MAIDSKSVFADSVLEGKVALITGGASGIGLEIATHFCKHGAKVAVMGRRKKLVEEIAQSFTAQGFTVIGVDGDVRKQEDATRTVKTVIEKLGKLDILINGAAGNFLSAAEDLSQNGFRTVMEIDTIGTFTMSQAALHYLKRGGVGKSPNESGAIINISATLHYTASWYQIHVAAAKAANDSMSRSLALEWGTDYGIRVNTIAPGPISGTPGMDKLSVDGEKHDAWTQIPLGKWGERWDIAMASIFLASDGAKYVNGATLVVDGGAWLRYPRQASKEDIRQFSRNYEKARKGKETNSKL